nr:hypothetical protein [uncultured Tolumonas sp.]
MSGKSFWNVDKEKKQISFLYHFLNLEKGELERQIEEQLNKNYSGPRKNQPKIDQRMTRRYPNFQRDLDVMQKRLDEATKVIGTRIDKQDLDYLIIPYCDSTYEVSFREYFKNRDNDVNEQAKKILIKIYESHQTPIESFSWINLKDDRLISYIWSRIRISFDDKNNQSHLCYSHELQSKDDQTSVLTRAITPIYEDMGLEKNASKNDIKLQNIIYFFDLWAAKSEKKQQALQQLGDSWEIVRRDQKMVHWLNENESYVIPIWDYITSYYSNGVAPKWSYISSVEKKEDIEQTKLALQTFYDLLPLATSKKTLLSAIKTNVRSRRHYEKHANTSKLLNTQVSIEAANALNELAKMKGKSKKAILENLIIEEFTRMKS